MISRIIIQVIKKRRCRRLALSLAPCGYRICGSRCTGSGGGIEWFFIGGLAASSFGALEFRHTLVKLSLEGAQSVTTFSCFFGGQLVGLADIDLLSIVVTSLEFLTDTLGLAVEHLGEEAAETGAFANGQVTRLELFNEALHVRLFFGGPLAAVEWLFTSILGAGVGIHHRG